jgi:outer membrane biosynthesis protein TonB
MRIGSSIVSLSLHAALAWGGITVAPALLPESEPVPMFDIELVTVAEMTNLKPAAAEEVAEEEVKAEPPPPPPPEPEEVVIPEEAAPPPPKPEPKREPKKEKEPDFQDELKRLMAAANSAPAPAKKEETPKNPFKNPGRPGVGKGDADTVTIEHYVMRQLLDNDCWSNQSTLADAQSMVATIRVRFGRDGRFSEEPKLIEPTRMPSGGPFLVYVTRAFAGLNKCNNIGFKIPPEYFTAMKSPTIDLRFKPGADL